ncbi:trimeric intracellular cation channel family protein [Marinilabiliaceae bacterium JC017]|nr:trimeric intracellular cation channel family protein [Marinilabiliaceae bacterium JC017]
MDLILYFDYIGTLVFAISGTLSAAEKKLDLFGAMVIGFVTAVGGGTVRDMMLGDLPVTWMRSMDYFVVIILGVIITIIFKKRVLRLKRTLFLFDTIGIGVFTIIGLEKALNMNIDAPLAVMMGLSTAVVGGVIRDTLCNDVPLIFKREIYATACIAGALVYLLLIELRVPQNINEIITVLTIIGVRLLAVRYNIKIPLLMLSNKNS